MRRRARLQATVGAAPEKPRAERMGSRDVMTTDRALRIRTALPGIATAAVPPGQRPGAAP